MTLRHLIETFPHPETGWTALAIDMSIAVLFLYIFLRVIFPGAQGIVAAPIGIVLGLIVLRRARFR